MKWMSNSLWVADLAGSSSGCPQIRAHGQDTVANRGRLGPVSDRDPVSNSGKPCSTHQTNPKDQQISTTIINNEYKHQISTTNIKKKYQQQISTKNINNKYQQQISTTKNK